jgi:prevent-host-death family protein
MILKDVLEAQDELSALLEAVCTGEAVIIARLGVPVARLVPYEGQTQARRPGARDAIASSRSCLR